VRATELIAAVSLAVDIGMAQPAETGLAVCLVAVELAERLGYEPGLMQRTFRLALLQHGHIQRIYAKTGVVHHEAADCEMIVVEKGLAVEPVHHGPPNPPPSPDPPRKS